MSIHYLETGSVDPCYNLALEQYILEHKNEGTWLMLWQNANTVVIGLNQNTVEEINADFISKHGITVVRRMTGGGAVYHDLGNLNYSFITDLGNAEELSISRFTEPVCRALQSLGVSAQTSGRNDILVDGKKISGVAQRIVGKRILHHGTLLFDSDPEMIAGALHADPAKFQSKSAKSVRARIGNLKDYIPDGTDLAQFWTQILQELTRDGMIRETLSDSELCQIRKLANEKYRSWDWTYGHSPDYHYRNRRHFPGGTAEVRMNVSHGRIEDIIFYGDFMATVSQASLQTALRGTLLTRDAVSCVLDQVDFTSIFGGIEKADILELILDEGVNQ